MASLLALSDEHSQPQRNSDTLARIVERIRVEQGLGREVPGFDPTNGNENARYLFVLEAPGPKAVASGVISLDNDDQTARNFRDQLKCAGVDRSDIALWNVVPWYLGTKTQTKIRPATGQDIGKALEYLSDVVSAIPHLRCIMLVGGAARRGHIWLSHRTTARILSCHHPSPKVQNTIQGAKEENVAIFRYMLATSK